MVSLVGLFVFRMIYIFATVVVSGLLGGTMDDSCLCLTPTPVALKILSLTALPVPLFRVLVHVLSAWRNNGSLRKMTYAEP